MANELQIESWPEFGREAEGWATPALVRRTATSWPVELPLPAGSERWADRAIAARLGLPCDDDDAPRLPPALLAHLHDQETAPVTDPPPHLRPAYDACTTIIKTHSASFYFSAGLLPPPKRHAVLALYAFCRLSDELVDSAPARGLAPPDTERDLADWAARCRPIAPHAAEAEPVVLAWADTRRRFRIPQALADELLAGVSMDIHLSRYATWADLWIYCYRVASTVGQMSMHITGAVHGQAANYAIRLGVALQLTNILRDVGEDARQGRIYLPLADLARFGYTPDELCAGRINDRFVALMQFEIARARALYDQAWPGIAMLARDSRLAVGAAATVYRAILDRIEANGYDVFTRRARVSNRAKLALLPQVWWQVQRM
ncbi:MAG: phytoene/squalene synthase family protein [Chloroflexota bacterium]|nr:phytoene/squalene synthase family protein [Chloroflexota bacterium]